MSFEQAEEPLVVIAVRRSGRVRWFRSERDLWVLDVNKWRDEFVAAGHDVPEFTADYRFGMPCIEQTNADQFLDNMSGYEVARDDLSRELAGRFTSASSWWDVSDLFPIMFVDFDNARVAGFYHEGTPMERYVADGWHGEFVDSANEYAEDVFPREDKFWIKGDGDLLQLLNDRGRSN